MNTFPTVLVGLALFGVWYWHRRRTEVRKQAESKRLQDMKTRAHMQQETLRDTDPTMRAMSPVQSVDLYDLYNPDEDREPTEAELYFRTNTPQ